MRTGQHYVKVNVEKKNRSPIPVVIHRVVIYVCYGLRKIMALQVIFAFPRDSTFGKPVL